MQRVPLKKAEVSGAVAKNAGRFKDRKAPPKARPIGEPYVSMSEGQKRVWRELAGEMPWLNAGHRVLLRLACVMTAKLDEDIEGGIGVSATHALSGILSKLGATPVDETKVNHGDDGDTDPDEELFRRPN